MRSSRRGEVAGLVRVVAVQVRVIPTVNPPTRSSSEQADRGLVHALGNAADERVSVELLNEAALG